MKSERSSFRVGMGYGALNAITVMLLALVTAVVVARAYGVSVLGGFALASAPALATSFLSSAQEQTALVRAVAVLAPRSPRITALFAAVLTFSTALTFVVAVLVALIAIPVLRGPIGEPGLVLPMVVNMAGFFALVNLSWNVDMLLSAFRAGRELHVIRTTQALTYLALALGFSFVEPTVWGLVWATIGSWALSLALRLVLVRRFLTLRIARAELDAGFCELGELVRFGLKLAPGSVAYGVSTQAGTWLIGLSAGVAEVGAYNRAQLLASRFTDGVLRLRENVFPTLVERRARGDAAGFDRVVVDSMRYVAFVLLLTAAVGGGAAAGVMSIFGPGFGSASTALAILLLGPMLAGLTSIQVQVVVALGRPWASSLVMIARAAVTLAATLPLTLLFGAAGAASGWILGYAFELAWRHRVTARALHSPFWTLWPGRQVGAQIAAYGAGFGVARVLDGVAAAPLGVLLPLSAGSVAYLAMFAACGGIGARDRDRLSLVATRLKARRDRGSMPAAAQAAGE